MKPDELLKLMSTGTAYNIKNYLQKLYRGNDIDKAFYRRLVEMFTECQGFPIQSPMVGETGKTLREIMEE